MQKRIRLGLATILLLIFSQGVPGRPPQPPPAQLQSTDWPSHPVRGSKAMVVSDDQLASDVGAEIMKRGGNAIDAAVAVGFALSVVDLEAGNIGGGGFLAV